MSFENKMAPSISNDVLFPAPHRMLGKRFLILFESKFLGKEMIYRNQQFQVISSLNLEINNTDINPLILQKIFGINKIQLERDIKNIGKVPGILKNKPCLTQEHERMIIDYINDQYSYHSPCSHIEVIDYASNLIDKHLSFG